MSKFTDFYNHLIENEVAKSKVTALAAQFEPGAKKEEMVSALTKLAAEEGFTFTDDEVLAFMERFGDGGELSEDELEAVAGGKGGGCFVVGGGGGNTPCCVIGPLNDNSRGGAGACIVIGAFVE